MSDECKGTFMPKMLYCDTSHPHCTTSTFQMDVGCSYPFTLAVDTAMSCIHHFTADDMNSLSLSKT